MEMSKALFQKIELEIPVFGGDLSGLDRKRQLLDCGSKRAAEQIVSKEIHER